MHINLSPPTIAKMLPFLKAVPLIVEDKESISPLRLALSRKTDQRNTYLVPKVGELSLFIEEAVNHYMTYLRNGADDD